MYHRWPNLGWRLRWPPCNAYTTVMTVVDNLYRKGFLG
jgi:hypothetical protein